METLILAFLAAAAREALDVGRLRCPVHCTTREEMIKNKNWHHFVHNMLDVELAARRSR